MESTQIFNDVNETQKEALGKVVINVKDTASLVSLGEHICSSLELRKSWISGLIDRVGRVLIAYRAYSKAESNLRYEPIEYGAILQKVQTYSLGKAKINNSWVKPQVNPFTVIGEDETDIMVTYFKKRGTFEHDAVIYDYQLDDSFLSASNYMAFNDMILGTMRDSMEFDIEQLEKLTRATLYAQAFKSANKNVARNLLKEYNTKFNELLTTSECLNDANFLKYASMEINKVVKRFPRMTSLFNGMGADRHTDTNYMVVECLSDYASATASYLESGVYHKNLVELPLYTELDTIQSSGKSYRFEDTSRIEITDEDGTTVKQGGIIACIRDKESAGVCTYRLRTRSVVNDASECTSFFHKCDWGAFVDKSANCVVFYVADDTDANPTLNVEVPTGATTVGNKTVNDLQDSIEVNGTELLGVSNYVTGFNMFPNTPNGNFIALKFTSDNGVTIKTKLVNAKETTDWQTLDSDGIMIVRITDKTTQSLIVRAEKDGKTTENIFNLARLTIDAE